MLLPLLDVACGVAVEAVVAGDGVGGRRGGGISPEIHINNKLAPVQLHLICL